MQITFTKDNGEVYSVHKLSTAECAAVVDAVDSIRYTNETVNNNETVETMFQDMQTHARFEFLELHTIEDETHELLSAREASGFEKFTALACFTSGFINSDHSATDVTESEWREAYDALEHMGISTDIVDCSQESFVSTCTLTGLQGDCVEYTARRG